MISKQRVKAIMDLALPVTVGLSSSFIMAIVDLAMVGRLGTAAVAAVGVAGFSHALISALLTGVTPAVQSIVSRRMGEKSTEPKCAPLNAGLMMALLAGIPLAFICYGLIDWYFSSISSDPEVARVGTPYLQALVLGMPFAGLANAFHGFWAGVARTRVYMLNILFVNLLNAGLGFVLIFGHLGFEPMGAAGAGMATSISLVVSALIYAIMTYVSYRGEGLLTYKPSKELIQRMLQIGIPAVFEAGFFAMGFLVFYWIVGRMGTAELAAMNVLTRISILMDLFASALGMAAITLVSRTLGEGDAEEAERWGWDVAKIGVVWITLLGAPLVLVPEWCLSIFLTDPATLSMAILPARLTGAFLGIASLIYIFATVLISLGEGKRVMIVSFATQWVLFLPGVWIVGVMMQGGLNAIMYVQLAYGALATTLIVAIWRDGRWKQIKI
ncbi:MATE family efflux transporter [Massilia sp. PAMC28688]|uniref:MATE family efflux transporter n=1 Tax=Massilia sp. PAMC28688 TaxID=2861283 RepID=UPI001C63B1F0|nr:MATE family efflux transporter [Massilia sp. PAMC28688]QYF93464.1 MATE family efflux transporter [Massilia sp. PAMC28688]